MDYQERLRILVDALNTCRLRCGYIEHNCVSLKEARRQAESMRSTIDIAVATAINERVE